MDKTPIPSEGVISAPARTKRLYKSTLWLTNLTNVSKTILEIGQRHREAAMGTRRGRPSMNLSRSVKTFYFLYLTGARVGEVLREPYPKVEQRPYKGWTVMHVAKQNEKHFSARVPLAGQPQPVHAAGMRRAVGKLDLEKSTRVIMVQNLPIDNKYEKNMWDCITDSGRDTNLEPMLRSWGSYGKARLNVTNAFSSAFKADLTDGETVYKGASLPPHILRHLRVFSLLFNKRYSRDLVQVLLGWDSADMFEEYTYIRKQLRDEEQLTILDKTFDELHVKGVPKFSLGAGFF